ncbi:MAG: leucine-rich repeat domain-containing protein, partial [Ruminococcus sp.]|nr:leucine-rich repeat domain-containing protein [Ruminococcus sp.]
MRKIKRFFAGLAAGVIGLTGMMTVPGAGLAVQAAESVFESQPIVGDYYNNLGYVISADGTVTITDYTGTDTSVVIPAEIRELPVTAIGSKAFYNCQYLTSVTIPESIESIGTHAFDGCTNLETITFLDDYCLTDIPAYAFYGCTSLKEIDIPLDVRSIGEYAFYGCDSLTSVYIPSRVETIGEQAFASCSQLREVTDVSGGSFEKQCFMDCVNLVCFKNSSYSIARLGHYIFENCEKLEYVILPRYIDHICESAFSMCGSLKDVYYAGSEEEFDEYVNIVSHDNTFVPSAWY